ncbi:chromosomal protein D1 isoform X1 [Embiotoca jacksoni]|uniref:chromosomal protein D1 isoform X1 n=2 Tax=Embiotoca jacksoni TaxID=100190 RepID=UPI003704B322
MSDGIDIVNKQRRLSWGGTEARRCRFLQSLLNVTDGRKRSQNSTAINSNNKRIFTSRRKPREPVRAEGGSMEEETKMAKTEQGDTVSNEGETRVEMSNSGPVKVGRGRPQGSKKLKVCVTDVNKTELLAANSNGGSTQPPRGRGRPRLAVTKPTEQRGAEGDGADNSVRTHRGPGRPKGSKKRAGSEDSPVTEHCPGKRGRPKKSSGKITVEQVAAEDLPNGGSGPKRGRPKGSIKRKLESLTSGEEDEGSLETPRKRDKNPAPENEASSEGSAEANGSLNLQKRRRGRPRKVRANNTGETSNGISQTPRRGRGRPRKNLEHKSGEQQEATDGSQPGKRGRGRPKGSLNKKSTGYKVRGKVGRPRRVHVSLARGKKRGRPRQQPAKRGRPRKYPLPSPEDLKKPKVWKPLGRPRKYPRVDPPEGTPAAPRRSRGRPRKAESKKGAHLRKSCTPSTPQISNDGPPRKRGRPPSTAKNADSAPRKRGRPKGSVNKNKARSEPQVDSTLPNHSAEESESPAAVAAVAAENEAEVEDSTETAMPIEHAGDTEETLIDQDLSFEVSNQA